MPMGQMPMGGGMPPQGGGQGGQGGPGCGAQTGQPPVMPNMSPEAIPQPRMVNPPGTGGVDPQKPRLVVPDWPQVPTMPAPPGQNGPLVLPQ